MEETYTKRLVESVESIAKSLSTLVEDTKASEKFRIDTQNKLNEFEKVLNVLSKAFGLNSK